MVPRNPSPSQSYNHIRSHQGGDDPDYILFLNHLRPDHRGASYVLHINNRIIGYEDHGRGGSSFNCNNASNKRDIINDGECGNFKDFLDPDDASIDGEYLRFLQHLKVQADGSMLLQIDDSSVVSYANDGYDDDDDEDVEKATAGDLTVEREEEKGKLIQIQDPKQENDSPPSLGKEVPAEILGGDVLSSFKSRLMESLKRPFDQREYDRLLTEAKKRKPIVKFKHLRTEDIPYETDELGGSYFHHYPDLRRKVKSADHVEGLMLLRGFFFWLQNLDHKGAYKPWESTLSNHCLLIESTSEFNMQ